MNTNRIIGCICALAIMGTASVTAFAQDGPGPDPFGGRLFPPKVILEHQDELGLSDSQRRQIREIVLSTQAAVSERQWDMREAYREVMSELDKSEIDESTVTDMVQAVLETENSVKLAQVSMLIRLRNLLTAEQVDILKRAEQ